MTKSEKILRLSITKFDWSNDDKHTQMIPYDDALKAVEEALAEKPNYDFSNWDVSNVTTMRYMFRDASSANPDTSNWDVSGVTRMDNIFRDSNLSVENLTACYENWSQLTLKQNVSFSARNTKYNASGQAGRDILVNTYNWIIEDGGQV